MSRNHATTVSETDLNLIEFGAGMEGNSFLESGWGAPEAGFVWSEGCFSRLKVPVRRDFTKISFSIWGYVPSGAKSQHLLIYANGLVLGGAEVFEKTILTFDLPGSLAHGSVDLFIYLPHARSPKEMESVQDSRRLGIALAAITLE